MRRFLPLRMARLLPAATTLLVACNLVAAGEPVETKPAATESGVQQTQLRIPQATPDQPARAGAPITDTGVTPAAATSGAGTGVSAGGPAQTIGGGETAARPSGDLAQAISQSSATGIGLQGRTSIISDPRIRGYRQGQIVTYGDGAFFFPARQDLDTAVSKFDANAVREITIIKGPYSAILGPGFSFIDIYTYDTPRYEHGFEWHGRSGLGYQTNGDRWQGQQSLWGGDYNWGYRLSYDPRAGVDYEAGGVIVSPAGSTKLVPSGYNSQSYSYAVGFDLNPDNRFELKGLRLDLYNVQFAGLYFDINHLDTEALALRYTMRNQAYFEQFFAEIFYNYTHANGDTRRFGKQSLLDPLISQDFGVGNPALASTNFNLAFPVQDRSLTDFTELTRGYRLAMTWGERDQPQLTVGHDLKYINQVLTEDIRLVDVTGGSPFGTGGPTAFQNLGIPHSRMADPGVFLEASAPVCRRIKVKGGFRLDFVHTDSAARLISGNAPILPGTPVTPPLTTLDPILFSVDPANNDLSRDFTLWSVYTSTEYRVDSYMTVLATVGYGERPPTLTELYAAGPFIAVLQQGLNRLIGDPHLNPERALQFDLGFRSDYGWLRLGATGFYSWIHDFITFDQNKGSTSNFSQVVVTNTDLATLAGGEIYIDFDATRSLTPFFTTSYVQGRDLTHIDNRRPATLVSSRRSIASEPLPGIPPLEIRTGLRFHEARTQPRWATELGVRSVMGQNLVARSLGEETTPGFTVFDFRGYWQVSESWLLTAGVENFGDKFYREHLDPRAGNQLFRPGTNFYLGAQLQY